MFVSMEYEIEFNRNMSVDERESFILGGYEIISNNKSYCFDFERNWCNGFSDNCLSVKLKYLDETSDDITIDIVKSMSEIRELSIYNTLGELIPELIPIRLKYVKFEFEENGEINIINIPKNILNKVKLTITTD